MCTHKVYIIILNWNGQNDTLECLESVSKLTYSNYKVLVVDNASSDDSVNAIRKFFPQIEIIVNNENLGFTGGNNVGIQYALDNGAHYVWLLNNDTVVDQHSLSLLVNMFIDTPNMAMVSPVIYYYCSPDRVQFCASVFDLNNLTITNERDINKAKDLISFNNRVSLWGTALLISTSAISSIGGLDDALFAYWEDTEYSIRAYRSGYCNKVCFDASIFHKNPLPESGMKKGIHYYYYLTRNKLLIINKHCNNVNFIKAFYVHILESLSLITDMFKKSLYSESDAAISGLWDSLIGAKGKWKGSAPPWLFRKFILFIICSHPYFIMDLLRGNFKLVCKNIIKKLI